jgi:hypothetical protein
MSRICEFMDSPGLDLISNRLRPTKNLFDLQMDGPGCVPRRVQLVNPALQVRPSLNGPDMGGGKQTSGECLLN